MSELVTRHAAHILRNRAAWDGRARDYVAGGRRGWAEEPAWGVWGIPEAQLGLLHDVAGRDSVELGCGTAYVAAWLARRGARVVGLDNSPAQLRTARALQREFGLAFPLVLGDAERAPLRGGAFDFVVSEYGASIWCDPYRWIPVRRSALYGIGAIFAPWMGLGLFTATAPFATRCDRGAPRATGARRRSYGGACWCGGTIPRPRCQSAREEDQWCASVASMGERHTLLALVRRTATSMAVPAVQLVRSRRGRFEYPWAASVFR